MQWREVRAALDELLAAPQAERGPRLERIRERDPALGAELAALLEHDSAAEHGDGFLARSPAATPGEASPATAAGRRVGPYELVGELGRGGMGVVHLARRADGAFERRVAIKLIQHELLDERVLERFRRERQVLADLEHPGIARLIEGGATEGGTPYLVMEYVEGVPIDQHCDRERLPLRARLELFVQVCDAVQHAHEHLVVHRDLKPRNILVTPAGAPKLLDFGIAKVLDPERLPAGGDLTIGGLPLMTPAYASPEQVAGRAITTASDVYSLGVVLYQLLTGRLPYRVETTSALEIERIVCGTEPGRPSEALQAPDAEARARARRTTPAALARALSGDLDRIVLAALRKDPRLRYPSVERLADDLRRHLAGLPVSARADTFGYRASKFVGRHRAGVAAAALLLASLVAGLLTTLVQYRRAEEAGALEREQRELAEERLAESRALAADLAAERGAAQARVVEVERLNRELEVQSALAQRRFEDVHGFATRLIFDLHGVLYPLEGSTRALELVVATGTAYLDRLAAEAEGDQALQRELAHAWLRMAEVQGGSSLVGSNLGRLEQALASVDKAVAIGRELVRVDPGHRPNPYTLASALAARGNLLRAAGHEDLALAEYEAAIEIAAPLEHDPQVNVGQLYVVYFCRVLRAQVLRTRVSRREALDLYRDCEALVARVVERFGSIYVLDLEMARAVVAELEHGLGGGVEAVDRLAEVLERLERESAAHPDDHLVARGARLVRAQLALVLAAEDDPEGALELARRNLAELEAKVREDPIDAQARADLVEAASVAMRALDGAGQAREALAVGEGHLQAARELVERSPDNAQARLQLARLLAEVGRSRLRLGRAPQAEQALSAAQVELEALVERHASFVAARRALVAVLADLGRARRESPASGGDRELARRALAGAVEHLARALAQAEALEAAGIAELDPAPASLRAELAERRAALASLGAGG